MFYKNPKQVYLPCFVFKKLILSAQMIINLHESILENMFIYTGEEPNEPW